MLIATPSIPNPYNSFNQGQVVSSNPMDDALWDSQGVSDQARLLALQYRIQKVIAKNEGMDVRTDVSIFDLQSDNYLMTYNQDDPHFAASINKLPVALLLLEDLRANKVHLDQQLTWTAADVRGGFGDFDQPGAPLHATLHEVLYDMLNKSGNTAVRVIVNGVLDGPQAVNDRLAAKPQLPHTRLVLLTPTRFFMGDTTSKESLWVMSQLMKDQDSHAQFMRNAMQTNIFTDFGVRSQLAANDYIVLVNKIGLLDDPDGDNRHDVGIIYNTRTHKSYGYSFLTTAPFNPNDYSATTQANESLMDMGRPLLRYAGGSKPTMPHIFSAPNQKPEKKILY